MTPAARTSLSRWMWVAAVGLMLAEFLVFNRTTARYHATIYPRWNDQIQYLIEAYTAHDEAETHGLLAGLKFALGKDAAQGTLHDTAAVVAFWVAGSASRTAALDLNMLAFLAWQAALLFAIPRVSGSRTLAWMAFGLVLGLAGPWSVEAGSAVDFRLDHAAMCLLGVTGCVALLTDGFRSTRWSLALGAAVGVTVLERFLTAVYFAPIFAVTVLWLLAARDRGPRLGHLLLAGVVAAALAVPVFWHNRAGIYQYYWVGQVTGAESAARLRGFDLGQSVYFIFEHFGHLHLGAWFGGMTAALTGLLLLLAIRGRRKPAAGGAADWLFLGLAFLLVPGLVLLFHRQKSEYVLSILVPGLVLLVLWLWRLLWHRIEFPAARAWHRVLPVLPAVAALAAGGGYFAWRELRPPYSPEFFQGAQEINRLSDYIFNTARAAHLAQPNVGVDRIVDFMDGRTLRVICYERHKVWVPFALHLPDSILAGPDDIVFFKLKYCDFFLLTDHMPDQGYWPYDQQMRRLYPEIKAWCNEHLILVENFSAFDRNMSFYQRQELP